MAFGFLVTFFSSRDGAAADADGKACVWTGAAAICPSDWVKRISYWFLLLRTIGLVDSWLFWVSYICCLVTYWICCWFSKVVLLVVEAVLIVGVVGVVLVTLLEAALVVGEVVTLFTSISINSSISFFFVYLVAILLIFSTSSSTVAS